ncbi:signal peptidase II [Patescibacteria group bacterium]|nr:signal peptidase II [Patescibacteria group bacterium]
MRKKNYKLIVLAFFAHEFLANRLDVVENSGVSFGIGGRMGLVISLLVLIFFLGFYKNNRSRGVELILIGAGINLLDRIRFSFVRDYWNLGDTGIYNNIADWLIFVGLLCFVYERYRNNLRR